MVNNEAELLEVVKAARRLLSVARNLAGELIDPGTEALAAIWCADQALANLDRKNP